MKRVTWGELRYAVLLIVLLTMAWYAYRESITFIRRLVTDDYLDRASRRLAEIVAAEESGLRDVVEVCRVPGREPGEFVAELLRRGAGARLPTEA